MQNCCEANLRKRAGDKVENMTSSNQNSTEQFAQVLCLGNLKKNPNKVFI